LSIDSDQEWINRTGVIIGWGDSSHHSLTNMINSFTLKQGKCRQSIHHHHHHHRCRSKRKKAGSPHIDQIALI
jgi:hypothetical protein